MPRRPNTKNLPSRLFEESTTPIYMVDSDLQVIYANSSLAGIFGVNPDEIVGKNLRFQEAALQDAESRFFALCPPPALFPLDAGTAAEKLVKQESRFSVCLPESKKFPGGQKFLACSSEISLAETVPGKILVCGLTEMASSDRAEPGPYWLHETIQEFRVGQSARFNAIPFLGASFAAQKCFAQARSYALMESNVSIVGHPRSQIQDIAKSIHYSGFTKLDEPEPLLPIDCQQVQGDRIQEILVGHCQVNLSDSSDAKAHVLLMHADQMDPIAQRDLLTMVNLERLQLRLIATSNEPLTVTEGFDEELAHRLSTLELIVPDLSQRRTDIPLLALEILERSDGPALSISDELIRFLQIYPWSSDYQELELVIQTASRESQGAELRLADCPHDFRMALNALENPVPKVESIDLDQLLADIEKEAIERAIKQSNGNKTNAARILGITRARLHRKIAEYSDLPGDE